MNEKKTAACCFCSDYPCPPLKAFMHNPWPHHGTMEPNLESIRQHDIEEWLQIQKQKWRCPNCGAETQWYQKTCACGRNLNAWELQEP